MDYNQRRNEEVSLLVREIFTLEASQTDYKHKTAGEREFCFGAAKNLHESVGKTVFLAHGNQRGPRVLAKILLDGKLVHASNVETYGELGEPFRWHTGHLDEGYGLFAVPAIDLEEQIKKSLANPTFEVPLNLVNAVILPTPVANLLKPKFPDLR